MTENPSPPPAEDHDPAGEHDPMRQGSDHDDTKATGEEGHRHMAGYQLGHADVVKDPVTGTSHYVDDPDLAGKVDGGES
ncbi:MAG: hypothetical protein NVSMB17_06740 [Candidatus Dormibacteria bacterium]